MHHDQHFCLSQVTLEVGGEFGEGGHRAFSIGTAVCNSVFNINRRGAADKIGWKGDSRIDR